MNSYGLWKGSSNYVPSKARAYLQGEEAGRMSILADKLSS